MIWHSSDKNAVASYFNVDVTRGLSAGTADEQLEKYGKNVLTSEKSTTLKEKIIKQFTDKMNILLILCAVVTFIIGLSDQNKAWYESLLIIIMVALNSVLCIFREKRAEEAVDTVKNLTSPRAKVLRDGIIKSIDSSLIVPGDIIVLTEGDYIPADARIIEAHEFHCEESVITGERIFIEKNPDAVFDDICDINKRINMVYSGCSVVSGQARAVVTETGNRCELGKAVILVNENKTETTQLKSKVETIVKISSVTACVAACIIFICGLFTGFDKGNFIADTLSALTLAISVFVAAVPEGLIVIVTAATAFSVRDLAKSDVIIRRLSAFDKLNNISVICADKTGILTHNTMNVIKLFDTKNVIDIETGEFSPEAISLLKLSALCTSQSEEDRNSVLYKDSTELAIINTVEEALSTTIDDIYKSYPRICKIPFNSERKIMTSVNYIDGKPFAISKAAPDLLFKLCSANITGEVIKQNEELTSEGYRVIAIGYKPLAEIPTNPNSEELENGLVFAGLIVLYDPPRSASIRYVAECDKANIRTVMITGDQYATAKSIARRIGILKDDTDVLTGEQLASLSDEELKQSINKYSVFAKVSPFDKTRIVDALKANGEIVAITGDSVNDAPAITEADVGFAVGKGGTDVARGAADVILNANNFSLIINSIKETHHLFSKIRNAIIYILSSNIGEFLAVLLPLIICGRLPLTATQFLWISLLTDCLPVYAIITRHIKNKPLKCYVNDDDKIFRTKSLVFMGIQSFFIILLSVIGYLIGNGLGEKTASSMLFTVLVFSQLANMITFKSDGFVIKDYKSNDLGITLLLAVSFFVAALLVITPLSYIFELAQLPFELFVKALILSLLVLITGELTKLGYIIYEKFNKQ